MAQDFSELPTDLPIPEDDGAGDRILGKILPNIALSSTSGEQVRDPAIK